MTQQSLNVGTLPNDGTGDQIRVAMIKVQNNFSDLYVNFVSNAQLTANLSNYQTTAGLAANVLVLTSNNSNYIGGLIAANVVSNAQLTANLTAYATLFGLSANVAKLTANNTSFVGTVSAANVVSNAQLSANLSAYQLTSGMTAYQTTAGLAANVATLTSNNSTYLNGFGSAYFQSAAGLAANVAVLPANNALYLGGVAAASYVNTSGAYTITGVHTHNANIIFATTTGVSANGVFGNPGQVLTSNGSVVYWANSGAASVNTLAQYTFSNTQTFSSNVVMNANVSISGVINTTGANVLNQTLTFASPNTVWATTFGTIGTLTLTGNTTLTVTGQTIQTYLLFVKQDSTGGRTITWGSNFKWAGGVAPVLTTNASATDLLSFVSDGTNMYGSFLPNVK